jgi:hypothetical protein
MSAKLGVPIHMVNAELTLNAPDRNELEKILFKQRQFYSTVGCRLAPGHDEQALHFQRHSGEE